ncbi:MAG TPA: HAMP domain-containing sensor histidine kinase [Egibacteraceae bacterium]|nr:HAMP domain-containing sensor histidine kinase [Egibacteraceae bacterium]
MRRRLLLSTLTAVVAAVLLLGAPLAGAVRGLLIGQALDELEQLAQSAGVVLDEQAALPADLGLLVLAESTGTRLALLTGDGRVLVDSGGAPRGAIASGPDVARAAQGRVGRARGAGLLSVAVPVERAGQALILRATADDAPLRRAVRRSWLQIAGLAATALAVGALLAIWQGRRLAVPLEDLAASARRLGEGDFSARAPRSGLPEPDDVASALDRTADRLAAMLERSRSFSADASHQLRTPLTALRLHLEALEALVGVAARDGAAAGDGAARLVTAAIAEADRLEATIEELLALAAAPAGGERLDLGRLVADRLDAWQALARAQGRGVVVEQGPAPAVRAREAAIGQCLQVLLDNALAHGRGTITVVVDAVGRGAGEGGGGEEWAGARLCVVDEGPGPAPRIAAQLEGGGGTSGRGLALARSLVEAEGGRLRFHRAGGTTMVCLLLPAEPADAPVGEAGGYAGAPLQSDP